MTPRFVTVTRADDPRLAGFRLGERGLTNRAQRRDDAGAGMFLAEGDLVVERALRAGCEAVAALADPHRVPEIAHELDIDVFLAGDDVRRMVTQLGMPQPLIALFRRPARPSVGDLAAASDRLVVLEGVDNPSNVGSIVRNAAALGWNGLVLDHTSADPLSRRALRVAMGTAFSLPHARSRDLVVDLVAIRDVTTLVALTPSPAGRDVADVRLEGPRAILVGAERSGLSTGILDLAHVSVRIPMAGGVDSLNVAAATAIACFALRR
jgi:tRNA G18 (ribose-2'-O)-methylase SpoU